MMRTFALPLIAALLALALSSCALRVSTRPLVSAQGVPLVQSACKDGGWQNLRNNEGRPFKNQGDCVSFTNSGQGF